jgi:uncharacterized membrane protein
MNKNQLMSAAIAGILTATLASAASAADKTTSADAKGRCMGANSCKGKSACNVKGGNDCSGQNSCQGKGWVEKTKAECDSLAKKDKNIKFQVGA